MSETMIPVPGRLHSVASEGHVAGADEIYDDTQSKLQSTINSEVISALEDKYEKPSEGIPKSDLISSVQASLDKADSALQEHQDISGKADKTATVSNITYDSASGKLKKTINGTTTDVCDVVQSGFVPTFNPTTGIVNMTPVGGATIAPNATTGLIEMNF